MIPDYLLVIYQRSATIMLPKAKLYDLFPLTKNYLAYHSQNQGSLLTLLQKGHESFFPQITYQGARRELTGTLPSAILKLKEEQRRELNTQVRDLVQSLTGKAPNDTMLLQELIPDVLLILLAHYQPSEIELDAALCLKMITAICKTHWLMGFWFLGEDKIKHLRKMMFLIEREIPGVLAKIYGLNEQKIEYVFKNIHVLANSKEEATAFFNTFPYLTQIELTTKKINDLYRLSQGAFRTIEQHRQKLAEFPVEKKFAKKCLNITNDPESENYIPDAILYILNKYEIPSTTSLVAPYSPQFVEQCTLLLKIGQFIEQNEPLPNYNDTESQKRQSKCYNAYFLNIFHNQALLKSPPKKWALDEFEKHLNINTAEGIEENRLNRADIASKKWTLAIYLEYITQHIRTDIDIKYAEKIYRLLFNTIDYKTNLEDNRQKLKLTQNQEHYVTQERLNIFPQLAPKKSYRIIFMIL